MTPRNQWRRRWVRETLIPVLWLLAASVSLGLAIGTSYAHAEPLTPGERFAQAHAADVCTALDSRPTVPGVIALIGSLHRAGLSDGEAGVALAESVVYVCPEHVGLLRKFIDSHATAGVSA